MFSFFVIATLLCGAFAQPWYAAGYCSDLHEHCTSDSWRLDCHRNPTVRRECPATCGVCNNGYYGYRHAAIAPYVAPVAPVAVKVTKVAVPTKLNYEHPDFVQPALQGVQSKYPEIVNVVQPIFAPYVAPVAPVCEDAKDDCAAYVSAGWCQHEMNSGRPGYVSTNCRRSCGLCVYRK